MQLYTYWRSSSAWRVRIGLNLKGISHTLRPINLRPDSNEQRLPAFKQLNPQAQVPVLSWESEGSKVTLAQSMAILAYLDKIAPEPRLFPEDPLLLAFALEAAELVNAGIQPLQNISVLEAIEQLGGQRQAFAASAIQKGLRSLEQLASARGRGFSVGDALSIADVLLIPQLYNARRFEVDVMEFPTLLAIETRCNALSAFQQAHPLQQPDAVLEPAAVPEPAAANSTGAEPKRSPRPGSAGVVTRQNEGYPEAQITKLLGVHYYVRNLERSRRFYVEGMDFAELGGSSPELEQLGRQRSLIFQAGDVAVVCSTPLGEGGRAYRYLRKHPDGIGTVIFEVQNIDAFFSRLERAGATPISDVETHRDDGGTLATFSITTPFGDTTFRFVERKGYRGFFPGMPLYAEARGGKNRFGIEQIDHITSNFQTMSPALMWLQQVMGFERFWDIEFHTKDVAVTKLADGSGLRSAVMRHARTNIKFANNEPYRPFFKRSQINVFNEEHRGDGIQHLALSSADIIATVRGLRAQGVRFMTTPDSYYEALPERLKQLGVGHVDEDLKTLNELGILVDGAGPGQYLLQIFLLDSAGLHQSAEAGPFFFEIIQRKGDRGFGAGNFRALFESIERDQQAALENQC